MLIQGRHWVISIPRISFVISLSTRSIQIQLGVSYFPCPINCSLKPTNLTTGPPWLQVKSPLIHHWGIPVHYINSLSSNLLSIYHDYQHLVEETGKKWLPVLLIRRWHIRDRDSARSLLSLALLVQRDTHSQAWKSCPGVSSSRSYCCNERDRQNSNNSLYSYSCCLLVFSVFVTQFESRCGYFSTLWWCRQKSLSFPIHCVCIFKFLAK